MIGCIPPPTTTLTLLSPLLVLEFQHKYLENTNDSQDLIDINVKKENEEDEDFIGALQDIQV